MEANDTEKQDDVQEKLIRSERLAAVGELASSVGHELRNPLNVIRNCVYLLNMHLTEKDDEEALKSLQVMDKQIDIANRIVTDLMDFTRLQPPSRQHTDLNSLVNESLAYASVPEEIRVKSALNDSSLLVNVDAEQIRRVFTNVILNACQAMNGQGDLDISMVVKEPNIWVSFRDSGCGITEENMTKIFEPLFTTKPKGFGLGLAISKRLVEQNDGEITVDSQVDHGAIFQVKLPLAERKKG
jgi:signal transduction histidine kinase